MRRRRLKRGRKLYVWLKFWKNRWVLFIIFVVVCMYIVYVYY